MPILQKLRILVSRAGVAPATPAEFGFVLGTRIQPADDVFDVELVEEQLAYVPASDGHLLLTGDPGAGKTVLLGDLADDASRVMEVHVVDSWGTMDKTFALQPRMAATIGFTPAECTTTLEIVLAEARRRVQQCELEGVAAFGELQDPPRRILLILDDARHLLSDDDYSPSGDRQSKERSVECLREIAATADLAGITLVLSSQWGPDESGLPAQILEGHLSRLGLKNRSYGFGNDRGYRVREGYWQPAGQPETVLAMQERKDERLLEGPAEPRGHVAGPGCC